MMSEGGVKSLWRGNFVNCVKIAPESSIKFFAYEHVRQLDLANYTGISNFGILNHIFPFYFLIRLNQL